MCTEIGLIGWLFTGRTFQHNHPVVNILNGVRLTDFLVYGKVNVFSSILSRWKKSTVGENSFEITRNLQVCSCFFTGIFYGCQFNY